MLTGPQHDSTKTVVLLSGGLDSSVALADQLNIGFTNIIALTFDYGQVNRSRELNAARRIAAHYRVEHRIIGLSNLFIPSALTGSGEEIPVTAAIDSPDATFVPGRNLVFISVGVAIAQGSQAERLVTGCNAADYGGYPDTRSSFMFPLADAVWAAYGVNISNPLLHMGKPEILQLADSLGVPTDLTWSCYRDGRQQCGQCGSCNVNAKAASR